MGTDRTRIFYPACEMKQWIVCHVLISRDLYQKLMHTNLLSRSLYQTLMICIGVYRSVHVTQILPVDWS